jgi:membrane protein implicated in regulation of membrane protease activity
MEFSSVTAWWIVAGLLVIAELLTGTFYLLMLSLGAVGGAIAAGLGLTLSFQLVAAAAVGGGATAFWHWRRAQQPRSAPTHMNRDVNLDIGERVTVTGWDADGTARVNYRGSTWSARLAPDSDDSPGVYVVVAVEGNHLLLKARSNPAS